MREITIEEINQASKTQTSKVSAPRPQVTNAIYFDGMGKRIEVNVKPKTEFTNSGVTVTKSRVSEEVEFLG